MTSETKTVRLQITGKVQNVWFRGWTESTANGLGLTGWVRNRKDGSVEAVVSGPSSAVDKLLAQCWNGPPAAKVTDVKVEDYPASPPKPGFHQVPTL